jgi:hypothetical protein
VRRAAVIEALATLMEIAEMEGQPPRTERE